MSRRQTLYNVLLKALKDKRIIYKKLDPSCKEYIVPVNMYKRDLWFNCGSMREPTNIEESARYGSVADRLHRIETIKIEHKRLRDILLDWEVLDNGL